MSSTQQSPREDIEGDCGEGEPPEVGTPEEPSDGTDNRPLVVVSDSVIPATEGTSTPDDENGTLSDVDCKAAVDVNNDVGLGHFMGDAAVTSTEVVDLLGLPEGDGQGPVVLAAVPYAPLRVPSFSGDDMPFQEVIVNDDSPNQRLKSALHSGNIPSHKAGGESDLNLVSERPGRSTRHVTFSISPLSKSSASIKVDICRICHLGPEQSGMNLVSPCLCSGTVEFTHHSCLTKWLAECGATNCELCGYKYRFQRITAFRPRKLKNTIWRMWCKWRVLNLGVVIDDRDTKMKNHIEDLGLEVKEKVDKSQTLQELNYLIQEEPMADTETRITGEGDGGLIYRMIPDYEANVRTSEENIDSLSNNTEVDNRV
ncbi:E3 ubiquitin-protein ligase MARCH4 [Holothuria leucospilota]|uniref:E3 ubiquitin-protein ligase MARCH4 n=1 Tax=Holothuria leucospilota TaxID=206669 RepID=A0A9Q0YLZ4_HOLLE|nr:E3 ubiquitin-protein ligase MARCH4 [Holothuria leucospilota]